MHLLLSIITALAFLITTPANGYVSNEAIAPLNAPFEMTMVKRPKFPDAVFPIVDFGAKPNCNAFNNSTAINKAITTCSASGGGTVLLHKGTYLSGPITLKNNVNLHFEKGAVLNFSANPAWHTEVVLTRYEGTELMNLQPFIYARDCHNIAITGPGIINGPGTYEWRYNLHILGTQAVSPVKNNRLGKSLWAKNAKIAAEFSHVFPVEDRDASTRFSICPSLIHPVNCTNVLFEDFMIGECGPKWTLHPVYCKNLIIRRICTKFGGHSTDAIAIDSCENTLVEYCDLSGGDDLVVVKSGNNEDGWRIARPTRNLVVRHVNGFTVTPEKGTVVMGGPGISIGSEISGGVENLYFNGNTINRRLPFRIKSRPGRGGLLKNITVENHRFGESCIPNTPWVSADELKDPGLPCDMLVQVTNAYRPMRNYDPFKITKVQGLTIRNTYARSAKVGLYIHPLYAKDFTNILIDEAQIDHTTSPLSFHAQVDVDLKNYIVAKKKTTIAENDANFIFDRTTGTSEKLVQRLKEVQSAKSSPITPR